jgi:hypothetical protein
MSCWPSQECEWVASPNGLFRCLVKVRSGPACELPSHLRGAFVDCFTAAPFPRRSIDGANESLRPSFAIGDV